MQPYAPSRFLETLVAVSWSHAALLTFAITTAGHIFDDFVSSLFAWPQALWRLCVTPAPRQIYMFQETKTSGPQQSSEDLAPNPTSGQPGT
jgi:hypothetical protein